MRDSVREIRNRIRELVEPGLAPKYQSFFRTGKGGYGEGDRFLGVRVPSIRKVVREYRGLPIQGCEVLLRSCWHEERLFALIMMGENLKRGDETVQEEMYDLYMTSTRFVNNWDLVDTSAYNIAGAWLFERDRAPLHAFARSEDLWEKRISIIATLYFIRREDFDDTLRISEILLDDTHDLIHKGVGWMLREIGNRDMETEETFLRKHYGKMPRTMLRYAIEKFPEGKRQDYLKSRI